MYIYLNVCPRMTQPNLELGFACSFLWCYIHPKNDKLSPIEPNRNAHQGTYTRCFLWESVQVSLWKPKGAGRCRGCCSQEAQAEPQVAQEGHQQEKKASQEEGQEATSNCRAIAAGHYIYTYLFRDYHLQTIKSPTTLPILEGDVH